MEEIKIDTDSLFALVKDLKETRRYLQNTGKQDDKTMLLLYKFNITIKTLDSLIENNGLGGVQHFLKKMKKKFEINEWETNVASAIRECADEEINENGRKES